jgi:hypothetical protein
MCSDDELHRRRVETAVQVDRGDDRFQRSGQQRLGQLLAVVHALAEDEAGR